MNEEEKIALFDAYLNGDLNQEQASDFEKLIANDIDLSAEFEEHKKLAQDIFEGHEYAEILHKLDIIHNDEIGKKKNNVLLKPKFLIPLGIAASIIFIVMVVNPFGNTSNEDLAKSEDYRPLYNEEEGESAYTEEEAELVEVYDTVEENATELDSIDDKPNKLDEDLSLIRKLPKGSAFLISNGGYFLTSKHLVEKSELVKLQQKDLGITFNAEVVYVDSVIDFAILKCSEKYATNLEAVPFKISSKSIELGEDVFTLGYPKSDIVYTKGTISSETGYKSDSLTYELSMASNPGNSGAPLFNTKGNFVGMIIANNSKKQSVTYILRPEYIEERLDNLKDSIDIDMSRNYTKRYSQVKQFISKYRNFVFEIH
ncbi:serine protease [Paracrocinitomix mangrovi]|uniref:S1 family peptidase n=1 Tax=Paracrocinitomix mangrovi TaxID=2862509 RepID=UPI001C8D18B3|nr:serine protease [Paracrocinitomix mangrovi]UKN03546.1 serine protease [Paracrocinitomix mangrovi]